MRGGGGGGRERKGEIGTVPMCVCTHATEYGTESKSSCCTCCLGFQTGPSRDG